MSGVQPPTDPGFSGRTTLVTGGAGFIGSHLVEALLPENEVRILDDCSTGTVANVPEDATLIRGDVTDPDALARAVRDVDVVFHHAAVVSVERSIADPVASHRVNVDGTLAVLEAAREANARVVVASSAAVYGDPDDLPIAEDAPTHPLSPYGADKLAVDTYARVFADVYDLPVVVLRYFNVYGPGQRGPYSGVVDAFFERATAGEPLVVHGDGEQTRDFVHVADVVRANLAAATTDHTGLAFNVGTGDSVSVRDLAETIRDVVGADVAIDHDDPRPGDVRHSRASTTRARDLLGFRSAVPLRDGLADLAAHRTASLAEGRSDPHPAERPGSHRGR